MIPIFGHLHINTTDSNLLINRFFFFLIFMKVNFLFFIVPFPQTLPMPSLMNTRKVQSQVQFCSLEFILSCFSSHVALEGQEPS